MARSVVLTRDEAELIVDVLEHNYETGGFGQAGLGADVAREIREIFGMGKQPMLVYGGNKK